jgi:hypothetical protein
VTAGWRIAGAVGVLAAMVVLLYRGELVALALTWPLFAAGAWLVIRLPRCVALALVVVGAAALSMAAASDPPRSSDDVYRYIWDGRVQAAGIDPYRYPPDAPQLRPLRDDFLWPEQANWCTDSGCTRINRPTVPTIYPPVAEALFVAVAVVSPPGSRERPMQAVGVLFAVATAMLLWYAVQAAGGDPRRAVLWAWCPLVAIEAGNNAHVDVAAVFLTAAALHLAGRGRTAAGVVLGLAVGTKLTPAVVLPAVVRRRPVALLAGVCGTLLAVYLPHLVAVGGRVLGYLPGYLSEEGYANGSRFALLSWLPEPLVTPAAVLLLGGVALRVYRTADPLRPWRGAAVLVAATLFVTAPIYPWYSLLLAMLVAYGAPAEWLVLAVAAMFAQQARAFGLDFSDAQRLAYVTALVVVAAGALIRHGRRDARKAFEMVRRAGGRSPGNKLRGCQERPARQPHR